jgi:hypothetical protein
MKADYVKLVDLILSRGHYISVDTGGDEPDVIDSRNRAEILEAIESVDSAEITAFEETPDICSGFKFAFWALIIPFGVEPYETVADYTDNGYWLEEIV